MAGGEGILRPCWCLCFTVGRQGNKVFLGSLWTDCRFLRLVCVDYVHWMCTLESLPHADSPSYHRKTGLVAVQSESYALNKLWDACFLGHPFHTPPLPIRQEDHLSNFLRHFSKADFSIFMMIDKFHNWELSFYFIKSLYLPFLVSGIIFPDDYKYLPHLTLYTYIPHKDEGWGFIYVLYVLLWL